MKKITLLVASISFLIACNTNKISVNSEKTDGFKINNELSNEAPKAQSFTINASKGAHIETTDGSKLLIPAGSFLDKNGKPVEGEVNVEFTAYRGAQDIISGGIPMQASNNGELGQFVSDGMFKIDAKASGNEVQIAKDKPVQVFQKSLDTKSSFQSWYFDAKQGAWKDLGKRETPCDDKKIEKIATSLGLTANPTNKKAKEIAATGPKAYDPGKKVLDLNFDKRNYPELSDYSKVMWQFAGNNASQDPSKVSWVQNGAWTDVKLDLLNADDLTYSLSFKVNNTTFNTVVTPALSGKDLAAAKSRFQQKLAQADNRKVAVENIQASKAASAELYNSFTVSNLGVYNCDRFYHDPNAVEFTPNCTLDNVELLEGQTIYCLTDNKTNVIQFNSTTAKMKLLPNIVDGIITVAAGGVIAAVEPNSIAELKNSKGSRKISLVFKKMSEKAGKKLSLREALIKL